MTATDAAARPTDDDRTAEDDLELLTDDGEEWTAVPPQVEGDERLTRWLTVDRESLRDLREWR